MVTNFLPYFSVYADKNLTHRLTPNDLLNLTSTDNELSLYLTLDDLVSGDEVSSQVLELQGINTVILFDVAKQYGDVIVRNYDLVDSIDVQCYFDTKPVIKTILKRLEGLYFYQQLFFLKNFDFDKLKFKFFDISKCTKAPLGTTSIKVYYNSFLGISPDDELNLFTSKLYDRQMFFPTQVSLFGEEPDLFSQQIEIPEGTFYEIVFSDKISFIRQKLTDEKFHYYMINTVLYGNGMFGLGDYGVLKNNRPTMYMNQDLFANSNYTENSSYYLSQVKHEIVTRWMAWQTERGFDGNSFLGTSVYKTISYDYITATKIIGLGIFDIVDRYNMLLPSITASGMANGNMQYTIYNRDYNQRLTASTIITTVSLGDGTINFRDRKKTVYDNGAGTEYVFFTSLESFIKDMEIDLDYIFDSVAPAIAEKCYWIVSYAITKAELNVYDFNEFYDKEHSCPFDDVETYVPIPIGLHNYDYVNEVFKCKDACDDVKSDIEKLGSFAQYEIYKRKYNENEDGIVTIEELPVETYPPGTFKIPINQNEYFYKVFAPGAIKTFISENIVYRITIKFKKDVNYMQNILFRLYTSDLTFATVYRVEKG